MDDNRIELYFGQHDGGDTVVFRETFVRTFIKLHLDSFELLDSTRTCKLGDTKEIRVKAVVRRAAIEWKKLI